MTLSQRVLFAGALLGGALLPSIAHAAISYNYVTDASTYNASANGAVTVTVYLQETDSSGSLIASDGGLFNDAFRVTRTGALPANPAALTSISADTAIYAGGSDPVQPLSGSSAALMGIGAASSTLSTGSVLPDADGKIELGTIVITAGGPGITTFTLDSYKPGGGWTTTLNSDFDLDVFAASSGSPPAFTGAQDNPLNETFSIIVPAAVPEPASLSLLACGALALLARRRKA